MLGHELPVPKSNSSAVGAAQVGGPMRPLKLIWLAVVDLFTLAWSLPQSLVLAVKQRQERAALDALEVERLDRLRNPSKYQGKS
jgi:hypothetical protein